MRLTLTETSRRFVIEYAKDLNAEQAAIRAGVCPSKAKRAASTLLGRDSIQAALEKIMSRTVATAKQMTARTIEELTALAFFDVRQLYDDSGNFRPPKDWPDGVAKAVAGMTIDAKTGVVTKVRVVDKTKAIEMIMRHLSLFNDKLDLSYNSTTIQIDRGGRTDEPIDAEIVGRESPERVKRLLESEEEPEEEEPERPKPLSMPEQEPDEDIFG